MQKRVDSQQSNEKTARDDEAAALLALIAIGEQGSVEAPLSFDDVIACLAEM